MIAVTLLVGFTLRSRFTATEWAARRCADALNSTSENERLVAGMSLVNSADPDVAYDAVGRDAGSRLGGPLDPSLHYKVLRDLEERK